MEATETEKNAQNERLHRVVVAGIVRIIKFLADPGEKKRVTFGELLRIGCIHLTKADHEADGGLGAESMILEFVKDGIVNMKPEHMDKVTAGDFADVWRMVNAYLKQFGNPPVEPSSIDELLA